MFVKFNGVTLNLSELSPTKVRCWRATSRNPAPRLLRRLGRTRALVTDRLRSQSAVTRELGVTGLAIDNEDDEVLARRDEEVDFDQFHRPADRRLGKVDRSDRADEVEHGIDIERRDTAEGALGQLLSAPRHVAQLERAALVRRLRHYHIAPATGDITAGQREVGILADQYDGIAAIARTLPSCRKSQARGNLVLRQLAGRHFHNGDRRCGDNAVAGDIGEGVGTQISYDKECDFLGS